MEHLLEVASGGDSGDANFLRELAIEFDFPRGNGGAGEPVPLGHWTDAACAYLEDGYSGLESLGDDPGLLPFCLGVLEALHTSESVELLNRLATRHAASAERLAIAASVNLVCSFPPTPELATETTDATRAWLHDLLDKIERPEARATVVCALRGVGDSVSLQKLAQLPPFPKPWNDLEQTASRLIKRRIRIAKAMQPK